MKTLTKIFLIVFIFLNILEAFAQSSNQSLKVFSSPDKAVAASAQSGSNAIQVLNTSGFASVVNLSWVAIALGLAVVSVWDGSDGEQISSSSTTTN